MHKVLGILKDWTRGDGLTDDQVDAIDAYYTSLKDCDYLGKSLNGLNRVIDIKNVDKNLQN